MTAPMIIYGLLGGLGGLVRGIVGVKKSFNEGKPFNIWYLLVTIILALIIGIIIGAVLSVSSSESMMFAFAAGYAGTDFLEGLGRALKVLPER